MSKDILPDDLLKEALRKAQEMKTSAYDKEIAQEEEHVFSKEYREKMEKLLEEFENKQESKEEKKIYSIKKKNIKLKILLIAAIVMLMGSMTVLAVEPLREVFYQLIEQIFSDHTYVSFEEIGEKIEANSKSISPENFEVHKLKNVPKEYTMKYEDIICEICYYSAEYLDKNKQTIAYEQLAVGYFDVWSITSDGTKAEEIAVNGGKGYLIADNEMYYHILYPYEGYVYSIAGYNDVEELVSLLELAF